MAAAAVAPAAVPVAPAPSLTAADPAHAKREVFEPDTKPVRAPSPPTASDDEAADCDDKSETSERSSASTTSGLDLDNEALEAVSRMGALLSRERQTPDFLSTTQRDGNGGVSESGRRDLMIWLREFNLFFGLSPGSYAVAALLVDRMLEVTRVKPEHADLVGVACLLIAAKDGEPEDLQPTLRELSRNCDGAFSEADIERMEALVHKKLGTTLPQLVVPLDYLDEAVHFISVVGDASGVVGSASFETLATNVMLSCTFHYELMSYRPSTLAMAVVCLELSRLHESERYADAVEQARGIMQVPRWDLDNCRRCVARCLKLRPHSVV